MSSSINAVKQIDWEQFSMLADAYFRGNALRLLSQRLNNVTHRDVVKDIISEQKFDVFTQYWNETEITKTTIKKEISGMVKSNIKAMLGKYHSLIVTKAFVTKKVKKLARAHGYKIVCATDLAKVLEKQSSINHNALDFAKFCKAAS